RWCMKRCASCSSSSSAALCLGPARTAGRQRSCSARASSSASSGGRD
ncbi:MAG: DNA mismatch repair protein MutL, partial [uncultured Chloroflexia bacterium]